MESRNFDGHKVEQALARLAGTFSVDSNDAAFLVADQPVVAVVVARLSAATSQIMKRTGVVRRTDVLDVTQFAVVHEPELQALLRAHLPQLETPEALDAVPPALYLPVEQEEPTWVPPVVNETGDNRTDEKLPEDVVVYDPPEEEVFSPGGDVKVPVGGSRKNDPVLARFMDDTR